MKEAHVLLEAKNKLRREGWVFWVPPRTWGERDIFGVFDLIAAKGRKMIMVQLTTIQHISDRHKKIVNFYREQGIGPLPNVFVWAFNPRKGEFKVRRIT